MRPGGSTVRGGKGMKVFAVREVSEALNHSQMGGSALHLHNICFDYSPTCFKDACWKRKEPIAHLYDMDKERLWARVKTFGVNVIAIQYTGTEEQHVDLCGAPLRRLIIHHYGRLLKLAKKSSIERLRFILSEYEGSKGWI
jgi:hypothetical protein